LRRLAKTEAGFGLIELLIAMTVMVIAIMGIVTVFSSGLLAINRASAASTAATLADKQMESFRKMAYAAITPTCPAGTSATIDCFPSPIPTTTGPDGRTYQVSTAVRFYCALGTPGGTVPNSATCTGTGASRPEKFVTIVVSTTTPATVFRETSTFDQATG
jgi:type II secretory pathway pseudopilin PulG